MNDYITLETNDLTTLKKKFRVTQQGYKPAIIKPGNVQTTVDGTIDNQVGPVEYRWQYVIRVYEADPTDPAKGDGVLVGYGTYAHLKTFFELDDPAATPSNAIRFRDFDFDVTAVVHTPCYLVGTFVPTALGPALEDTNAVFEVPILIVKGS